MRKFKRQPFRVCFCASSIKWIRAHLTKAAKKEFTKMLGRSPTRKTKTKRKGKRAWMVKGSKAAKTHMRKVRNARK